MLNYYFKTKEVNNKVLSISFTISYGTWCDNVRVILKEEILPETGVVAVCFFLRASWVFPL